MIKGGYQIIDLKGIELDDTPVTYDGIYDKMLDSVGKVCLVANVDVNDPNFDHFFVQPVMSGTTILCTVGNKTLKVNAEDGVSVEAGIVGGGSSGTSDYTDLSNKPSINSVSLAGNKTSHDLGLQDELTAGSNVSISEGVISATDTTYSAMTGATASTAGTSGLVPAPAAGEQDKALCGDGTYHTIGGSTGPKITLSGTINTTNSYSGFNDMKLKHGTIPTNNHNVVMNCPTDLKPLITTTTYGENVLTVPVEGNIFTGATSGYSCYVKGVAYIWETSSRYNIDIRCTCARGSYMNQSIYTNYYINKSSMSDPTKLILTNEKVGIINYFTASVNLGLNIETYTFNDNISITTGLGSGPFSSEGIYDLYTILNDEDAKLFIRNLYIDGVEIPGYISAFGHGESEYDGELQRDLYSITLYFLSFVMVIKWNSDMDGYAYDVSIYS